MLTSKDVLKIPLSEAEKVLTIINKAFDEKPDIIRHFKLLSVDMGFIPNLERISLGEYIDVENNIVDWQTMHKAMAVLYRQSTSVVKINIRLRHTNQVMRYLN